jgi:hypothetical protein
MDGDADYEDGGDEEPSLAAPENHEGGQVGCMRGNDQDREAEAPEATLPPAPAEQPPANVIEVPPMRWGGRGNIIAAAGSALLDLAGVR